MRLSPKSIRFVLGVTLCAVTILCAAHPYAAVLSGKPRSDFSEYFKAVLVPKNTAKSFLIYHLDTEKEVACLNAEYSGPVASLTKMMTAVIADEMLDYGASYKLTEDEAKIFKVESLSLEQMLEMALIPSNNLSCRVIARLLDGNETAFVARMNRRARELGMLHTLYANSSGLPSKAEQYSTVYDQLLLAMELLSRPVLADIVSRHYIVFDERYDSTIYYLKSKYPVNGVKSGWTNAAGRCLVLLVDTGKYGRFIVITMGSGGIAQGFVDAEIILTRFGLVDLADDSLLAEAYLQEKEREAAALASKEKEASGASASAATPTAKNK